MDETYSDDHLRRILTETRVIALVGASGNPDRPSWRVMRFLQRRGYRVIPVNPGLAGHELHGEPVYPELSAVPEARRRAIDMVDLFRNADSVMAPVEQAIAIGARTVWMQLGVFNAAAAAKARAAGIAVVMNRCPAIEIPRLLD